MQNLLKMIADFFINDHEIDDVPILRRKTF